MHDILAHQELMENRGSKVFPGLLAPLDQMASCLALRDQKEEWATLGLLVSQGLEGRKDGKVKLGTANAMSSLGVFQDCQDPRVFPVPMGSWGRKATKENLASTASLGSQDSRELLA